MRKKRTDLPVIERVEILDAGAEGNAVARSGEMVIFVPYAVPGDVVDISILRKKRSFAEGRIKKLHHSSPMRTKPFCSHFGICGGCKWQHLSYEGQLRYKQKQVADNLTRIGKLEDPPVNPILPSPKTTGYRNKLEFTYSSRRWWTCHENNDDTEPESNALGFHIPGFFDKVLDIEHCYLQPEPSNAIRSFARRYARQEGLSFYDVRQWEGLLRNLIIRNTTTGDLMVIQVFRTEEPEVINRFMEAFKRNFPEITSLYYVINSKKNDVISDLTFHLFHGEPWITEQFPSFRTGDPDIRFRIGPASFFQTNPLQAIQLYQTAAGMAGFTGNERVIDLYSGTGTIANYIARSVVKVTGIESAAPAVEDARTNAALNNINNTFFVAGEAEKILTPDFLLQCGGCDTVITDPPRAGMHEKVIATILATAPEKVIYISCNPATQARDIAQLSSLYEAITFQPVDMFPHTHHVENVGLLKKKSNP